MTPLGTQTPSSAAASGSRRLERGGGRLQTATSPLVGRRQCPASTYSV